jgi:hypothetical protein
LEGLAFIGIAYTDAALKRIEKNEIRDEQARGAKMEGKFTTEDTEDTENTE